MFQNFYVPLAVYLVFSAVFASVWSYGKDGCRGSTSRHVDPTNCHSYFQCIGGVRYRARCEPGMAFTKLTQKCEISVRTPCSANKLTGHSMVGKKCSVNNEIKPSELECDKYLLCRVRTYIALTCPFGLIFSNIKYRCVLPPNPCTTVAEQAANTTLKEMELKKEENPYIGICDNKINQTVAEPFDCSFYIMCEEDRGEDGSVQAAMSVLECPKGTLFSVTDSKCISPQSVFCDQRYRMMNLYGPDVLPTAMGRSFGRSVLSNNTSPRKPKFWVQPGKYRAISKSSPANETDKSDTSNKTSTNSTGNGVVTTVVNGFIIQKPLVAERPTPVDEDHGFDSSPTGSGRGRVNESSTSNPAGRSFRSGSGKVSSESSEETGKPISGNGNPNSGSGDTKTGTGNYKNTAQKSLITNNINNINGSNHQPIVVNIILDENHRVHGMSSTKGKKPKKRITVAVKDSNEMPGDKTNEKSGRYKKYKPSRTGTRPKPFTGTPEDSDYVSQESDEDEPFKFDKSRPRGPKRRTLLEDYHAIRNGQRFNSTADDILYYGEDEYYIGDSVENGTAIPTKPNRLESSLELTHHVYRSGSLPKQKLPKKA